MRPRRITRHTSIGNPVNYDGKVQRFAHLVKDKCKEEIIYTSIEALHIGKNTLFRMTMRGTIWSKIELA